MTQEHRIVERYHLLFQVGQCLAEDNRYREAIELFIEVHEWEMQHHTEVHPSRLQVEHELAGAYLEDGQFKKAAPLFEHVVDIQETILEEEDLDRLASEYMLAMAYLGHRHIKEGIELLEHVTAIHENILPVEDYRRVKSMRSLAHGYRLQRYLLGPDPWSSEGCHECDKHDEIISCIARVDALFLSDGSEEK